jgi:hypothetical protein
MLDEAASPREVVSALARASGTGVGTVLVFIRRDQRYLLKGGGVVSRPSTPVTLEEDEPSVLRAAAETGPYLGSLPATPAHQPISELLPPGAAHEVYAVAVRVRERVALVLLTAGFSRAYLATKAADELAERAGARLESLIVSHKRRA